MKVYGILNFNNASQNETGIMIDSVGASTSPAGPVKSQMSLIFDRTDNKVKFGVADHTLWANINCSVGVPEVANFAGNGIVCAQSQITLIDAGTGEVLYNCTVITTPDTVTVTSPTTREIRVIVTGRIDYSL